MFENLKGRLLYFAGIFYFFMAGVYFALLPFMLMLWPLVKEKLETKGIDLNYLFVVYLVSFLKIVLAFYFGNALIKEYIKNKKV